MVQELETPIQYVRANRRFLGKIKGEQKAGGLPVVALFCTISTVHQRWEMKANVYGTWTGGHHKSPSTYEADELLWNPRPAVQVSDRYGFFGILGLFDQCAVLVSFAGNHQQSMYL